MKILDSLLKKWYIYNLAYVGGFNRGTVFAMENIYMTIKELAKYLRVKQTTVYNWVSNDRVPASKVVGQWRFKRSEIEQWIEKGNNNKNKVKSKAR